jgi:hypothetical protein
MADDLIDIADDGTNDYVEKERPDGSRVVAFVCRARPAFAPPGRYPVVDAREGPPQDLRGQADSGSHRQGRWLDRNQAALSARDGTRYCVPPREGEARAGQAGGSGAGPLMTIADTYRREMQEAAEWVEEDALASSGHAWQAIR